MFRPSGIQNPITTNLLMGNNWTPGVSSPDPNTGFWYSNTNTNSNVGIVPIGFRIEETYNPAGAGATGVAGFIRGTTLLGNNFNTAQIGGLQAQGRHAGGGLLTDLVGIVGDAKVTGSGNVTNSYGTWYRTFVEGSGSIDTAMGTFISSPFITGTGHINNLVGVYINPQTAGLVTNYAIYYLGAAVATSFSVTGDSKVGIGTLTPTKKLHVVGDALFTSTMNFGTHAALAGEVVSGYITINDAGGTARKLAVVS